MHLLKKAITIDKNFSPAYNALGMIYDKLENYDEAYK